MKCYQEVSMLNENLLAMAGSLCEWMQGLVCLFMIWGSLAFIVVSYICGKAISAQDRDPGLNCLVGLAVFTLGFFSAAISSVFVYTITKSALAWIVTTVIVIVPTLFLTVRCYRRSTRP